MKTVILAGGLGTRIREETEFKPKPMVEIGGKPIIWHIMKCYAFYGMRDFSICTGYKGDVIKNYFTNFYNFSSDIKVDLSHKQEVQLFNKSFLNWEVSIHDTGLNTNTGGRIFKIRDFVDGTFLCTYGDGLSNVNLKSLVEFHKSHGKIATVTAVNPSSRFGVLEIEENGRVSGFQEKPAGNQWVNGGFFVFEKEVFNYMSSNCVLESDVLDRLFLDQQLMSYKHHGFWRPMDTYRESLELNGLWEQGMAPWKIWND
jgi:glucose-1-phosphate cytidylyltransferase